MSTPKKDNSENYAVEPEQLRLAAEEVFDKCDELDREVSSLVTDSLPTESVLTNAGLEFGNGLGIATAQWRQVSLPRSTKLLNNIGQFLATHAETSITVDEFSAAEFSLHADSDRFETNSVNNDEPLDPTAF